MAHKLISFILAESFKLKKGELVMTLPPQSAPHYFATTIPPQHTVGQKKKNIDGQDINFLIKSYHPDILVVEATTEINDAFSIETFELRKKLIDTCQQISKEHGGSFEMSEEYSVAVMSGYQGGPEQFFNQSPAIVRFLKSEKIALDDDEIKHAVENQIKYARNDLTIIGWDGAFVFEPGEEYQSDIELFQIATLQLLRYRILEQDLSERLTKASKLISKSPDTRFMVWSTKDMEKAFKEVISLRGQSISQFDVIEREIKLIGDWYSAKLYEMLAKMFRFDEWRVIIKDKLESIEDVYNIISENFSVTRYHALEVIQMVLFFVLQLGWFILIFLELKGFLK